MRLRSIALLAAVASCTSAGSRTPPATTPSTARTPTTAPAPASTPAQQPPATPPAQPGRGPRPYKEVVTTQAKSDSGLFTVHQVGDRWLYEIPVTLLNREMLWVSRIAQTAANVGYGGEENLSSVVRWQRTGNRVLLRYISYQNRAPDSLPIAMAIKTSNFEPIVQSFDIAAFSPDSSSIVIDAGVLFTRDIPMFGLPTFLRTAYQVRRLDDSRTLVSSVKSFPTNIEVRNILTYDAGNPPSNAPTGTISIEMQHSMVLLPAVPMRPRIADARVGYFQTSYLNFANAGQSVESAAYINRWRLEPKDPAAYQRGELTEPVKPIVYYIDPATPVKWRKYLKEAVNAWQPIFEKAGFKNAIMAKDAPTPAEDPDWSAEDARYSVIRYFASTEENAYGPQVVDPRSGEVMDADIGWYHNVTNIFSQLYRLQVGSLDPRALQRELPEEVVGALIRYVAAHEVGHTLGLRHSHGVSAAVPVDSLRSQSYLSRLGSTTPSIMDYARWNYVAQPGDGVTTFSPWFGPYDGYAINWGYRVFGDAATPQQEKPTLDRLILEKANDPMYRFVTDEDAFSGIESSAMNEQLGDNAARASRYGIANLKRVSAKMTEFTAAPGADYSRLQNTQTYLQLQWNWLVGHVVGLVGGRHVQRKTTDQPGPQWTMEPKWKQIEAMRLLRDEVWTPPSWIAPPDRMDRLQSAGRTELVRSLQQQTLNNLLDFGRLQRLIEAEERLGDSTYTLQGFLSDLRGDIWSELRTGRSIPLLRRQLQRGHIERLRYLMTSEQPTIPAAFASSVVRTNVSVVLSDIRPLVRADLERLLGDVRRAASGARDSETRAHLRDAAVRIDDILNPRR